MLDVSGRGTVEVLCCTHNYHGKITMRIRTPRLVLRPRCSNSDDDDLRRILSDECVMQYVFGSNELDVESFLREKFTYGRPLQEEKRVIYLPRLGIGPSLHDDEVEEFLVMESIGDFTGLGVVALVDTDEIVGFAGLLPCDLHDLKHTTNQISRQAKVGYEFGFVLDSARWGQGLATEIGEAQIKLTFTTLDKVNELYGLSHPENTASIKVLNKLGLKYLETIDMKDRGPRRVFCFTRQQYQEQKEVEMLRLHSYEIVDLNTNDVNLMKQWQEMHLEWLTRHGLWEPADQVLAYTLH